MFRSILFVLSVSFAATFSSGALAVTLQVQKCTASDFATCSPASTPYTPGFYKLTLSGSPQFQAARFPAGNKVILWGWSPGSWSCENQNHYTDTAKDSAGRYNGVICKGGLSSSAMIQVEVPGPVTTVDIEVYQTQSGSGAMGDPVLLNNEVTVSGGDDVPSTIPSVPTIPAWGAMGIVLLLLTAMSWFLWPRLRRNEIA